MELIFALLWVLTGALSGVFVLSLDKEKITLFDIFFVAVVFGALGLVVTIAIALYYSDKIVVFKRKQDIIDKESQM